MHRAALPFIARKGKFWLKFYCLALKRGEKPQVAGQIADQSVIEYESRFVKKEEAAQKS